MSWQRIGDVKIPAYFTNYQIDATKGIYMGYGRDAGYLNYYVSGIGYVIANSFCPFSITSSTFGNIAPTYRQFNGYMVYESETGILQYDSNKQVFNLIQNSGFGYAGNNIETYTYRDSDNQNITYGTNYFQGIVDFLVGTPYTLDGRNGLAGQTDTFLIQRNYYLASNPAIRTGIYTDRLGQRKMFGTPYWKASDGDTYTYTSELVNGYPVYKSSISQKLDLYNDGSVYVTEEIVYDGEIRLWYAESNPRVGSSFNLVLTNNKGETLGTKTYAFAGCIMENKTAFTLTGDFGRWN